MAPQSSIWFTYDKSLPKKTAGLWLVEIQRQKVKKKLLLSWYYKIINIHTASILMDASTFCYSHQSLFCYIWLIACFTL
jgi:hypothetical protein